VQIGPAARALFPLIIVDPMTKAKAIIEKVTANFVEFMISPFHKWVVVITTNE
jgi:hypothetical protein